MFGVAPKIADMLFKICKQFKIVNNPIHLLWMLSFLKMYLPIDVLHALWNTSYTTFNSTVWNILENLVQSWDTISLNYVHNFFPVRFADCLIVAIIDTTECFVLRPSNQEEQEEIYSGYKKAHTLKYLTVISVKGKILFIDVF